MAEYTDYYLYPYMFNPYAAFNVSDDEDDVRPTVVKAHDKPHRSIPPLRQPIRSASSRKN